MVTRSFLILLWWKELIWLAVPLSAAILTPFALALGGKWPQPGLERT
jgi:hypothetical protein